MTEYRPKSDFLRIAIERGYFFQCTDIEAFDKALLEGPQAAYVGYDCTADSLHVGNLLSIMLLRWFQKTGNRPVVLMGGGTTKIGDPSGKDETRKMLTLEGINQNMQGIRKVFDALLTFGDGPTQAVMANNADWLDKLGYIELLREVGPHFTVNRMLTFDSVKSRLDREQPLTFLEFNYMILQAYDFVELNKRYGVRAQFGGSDQWGNIVNGIELGRRTGQASGELFGLTIPLLTTANGAKMGKSVNGAMWLNADRLSPFDYYQFWRNADDRDVERFLKLYTDLPLAEIAKLAALEGAEINEAKKILALEATALIHGMAAAEQAAETALQTFAGDGLSANLPTFEVPTAELEAGIAAFVLLQRAELAATGGEARRLIKGGGARLNDEKINDETQAITANDANADGLIKLSSGKKKHALIKLV